MNPVVVSRGRDRSVALSAAARKASEERAKASRRSRHSSLSPSPSPSPASSAFSSPRSHSPTPPLTLSDQIHIAYAADDLHLAKVLLLRLQGIEVTSDSDPRIAAVTEDAFHEYFVPYPLDDTISVPLKPTPKTRPSLPPPTEQERRRDNLKAKEKLWETEARRFAEEKLRWDSARRARLDQEREQDRVRLIKQKEAAAAMVDLRRKRMKPAARTLNFALVPAVPPPPPKFTYDFPFTPRTARPPPAPRISPVRRPEPVDEQQPRQPNRVSFQEVLACMQGDLFPILPEERIVPQSRTTKARRQAALREALLDAGITMTPPDPKGKGRAVPIRCTEVVRTPPSPSPSTPSSSGLSRAGSWLSFGSSSRSSTSTAPSSWISTESSPITTKSPLRRLSVSSVSSWLPGARRTASPEAQSPRAHVHAADCRCRDSARQLASAHPLMDPPSSQTKASRSDEMKGSLANTLGRLTALAKSVQSAYVRAVVVGYGGPSPEWDQPEDEEYDLGLGCPPSPVKEVPRSAPIPPPPRPRLLSTRIPLPIKPSGQRASVADVRDFVSSLTSVDDDAPANNSEDELVPSATLSQLTPRLPRLVPTPPARTQLPATLPYDRVFAPPVPLPRSPWATLVAAGAAARVGAGDADVDVWAEKAPTSISRDITDMLSSDWQSYEPVLRDRAVPNPAFLRVKALHNYAADVLWTHASSVGVSVGAMLPTTPRWPKEAMVAQVPVPGARCAAGSRLRFVYSRERGVLV
uniref:Uncharacterized protein n=1 Tax=Mycena chlorophos TaxID=658473 RepID=A0ABQ0MAE2_MYCCL|nr:predicted protein [Mycena chlorophos]